MGISGGQKGCAEVRKNGGSIFIDVFVVDSVSQAESTLNEAETKEHVLLTSDLQHHHFQTAS